VSYDHELAAKVARAELVKRVLITVTTLLVGVILIVVTVLVGRVSDVVTAIRETQQEGSPVLKAISAQQDDIKRAADSAQETNEQVLDCLEPEGVCYQESQKRTADLVTNFNRVVIYAAACASGPRKLTVEEIQSCVIDRLAADPPVQP
jgi:predicted PurR-regulated permease PerM